MRINYQNFQRGLLEHPSGLYDGDSRKRGNTPTLDWIGKKAVVNHHREVPHHLLKCDRELSVGDPGGGSLLVQGDNLLALKALLPYYAGPGGGHLHRPALQQLCRGRRDRPSPRRPWGPRTIGATPSRPPWKPGLRHPDWKMPEKFDRSPTNGIYI